MVTIATEKTVCLKSLKDTLIEKILRGTQVLNILTCFIVLYSACSVDGKVGDGTDQGNCATGYFCQADGKCQQSMLYQLFM